MTLPQKAHIMFLLGAILSTISPIAAAQCATGVNTGGGNCIPPDAAGMPGYDPGTNNNIPIQQDPKWADQWGAIVIARSTGEAGTAINKDNKANAVDSAMHDCQLHGAKDCEVILTYHNQCAAVALGDGASGIAHNPSEDAAKDDALEVCGKKNAACKVVYSACSIARRLQ